MRWLIILAPVCFLPLITAPADAGGRVVSSHSPRLRTTKSYSVSLLSARYAGSGYAGACGNSYSGLSVYSGHGYQARSCSTHSYNYVATNYVAPRYVAPTYYPTFFYTAGAHYERELLADAVAFRLALLARAMPNYNQVQPEYYHGQPAMPHVPQVPQLQECPDGNCPDEIEDDVPAPPLQAPRAAPRTAPRQGYSSSQRMMAQPWMSALKATVKTDCIGCHRGGQNGINLDDLSKLTPQERGSCYSAVRSSWMPFKKAKLPAAKIELFKSFKNYR